MPPQADVFFQQGFGVVGEIFDDGPHRAEPFRLVSVLASYNVFGRAFTVTSEGEAEAGNPGGTAVFAGILITPKEHPLFGDGVNPLNPSLTLPNQTEAALLNMGSVIVSILTSVPAPASIGDIVIYDNTTGVLETIAPGAALPVGKSFAHAVVDRFTIDPAGLAVIRVTDVPTAP